MREVRVEGGAGEVRSRRGELPETLDYDDERVILHGRGDAVGCVGHRAG
jgi:hypothetical protein